MGAQSTAYSQPTQRCSTSLTCSLPCPVCCTCSDILTPLPALGVAFDIDDNKGPLIDNPIRTMEQVGRGLSPSHVVCGIVFISFAL